MDTSINELGDKLKEQIQKLAIIQYLIWQRELPHGFNREAIELSFCYSLLDLSFQRKIDRFLLGIMQFQIAQLAEKHKLPKTLAELKILEKTFRLEVAGEVFSVSSSTRINQWLKQAGSTLRLCSGFYGASKFYLLGEATEKEINGYNVYRLKREIAVTPGCHLLMAAMVGGKNVYLREASARFLYYQKWKNSFDNESGLSQLIKKKTMENFFIHSEADFKANSKKFIAAFMDNLLLHEINHDSLSDYINDEETLGIGQASMVLGPNVLYHLGEIFTDWLPAKGQKSPLLNIFEKKDKAGLTLYLADNWFYETGFAEQHIYTSLDIAPLLRHFEDGQFNWSKLIEEIKDRENGSLLHLYTDFYAETARGLKKIVKEAEYVLTERPINFKTIAAYAENDIKQKNKNITPAEYRTTFWSNVFTYLKKFSKAGRRKASDYLDNREKELEAIAARKYGRPGEELRTVLTEQVEKMFGEVDNA